MDKYAYALDTATDRADFTHYDIMKSLFDADAANQYAVFRANIHKETKVKPNFIDDFSSNSSTEQKPELI